MGPCVSAIYAEGRTVGALIGLENRDGFTAVGVRSPYLPPYGYLVEFGLLQHSAKMPGVTAPLVRIQ